MSLNNNNNLPKFAKEVLEAFAQISESANELLPKTGRMSSSDFAYSASLTQNTLQQIVNSNNENRQSCERLCYEPAIARVIVRFERGGDHTYYICRGSTAGDPPVNLASYQSPLGQLASMSIGDVISIPRGTAKLLERAELNPEQTRDGWESRNTIYECKLDSPITIKSLRVLLPVAKAEKEKKVISEKIDETPVQHEIVPMIDKQTIEASSEIQEILSDNIIDGIRRNVITKMELRDQPILDKYQSEIFRLPINKQLLLLGPPGTGKTTTLIRRLGQKLHKEYLTSDEKYLVESIDTPRDMPHSKSWLMFTPTELLKQYLKEAFAREEVPASDLQIHTWDNYRHLLARNTFDILRTSRGDGFVLTKEKNFLQPNILDNLISWYEDFNSYQQLKYIQELRLATATLIENVPKITEENDKLLNITEKRIAEYQLERSRLYREIGKLQAGFSDEQKRRDFRQDVTERRENAQKIDRQLGEYENYKTLLKDRQKSLLQLRFLSTELGRATDQSSTFESLIEAVCRVKPIADEINKVKLGWKEHGTDQKKELSRLPLAGIFTQAIKYYITGVARRYHQFRLERQRESKWYGSELGKTREIQALELDILLLAILRTVAALYNNHDTNVKSLMKAYQNIFRNQILVDEVTDFSPIQLACMAALSHPTLCSLFACGDFHQRITVWGTRSIENMQWVFSSLETRRINVAYRQSEQLNALAIDIVRVVDGIEQDVTLPARVDNNGVSPVLMEHATGEVMVCWLAERICEIERFVEQLPSIAIFVNTEAEVVPLATALATQLSEFNIQVVACHDGQSVGHENNIRVFDIQHIKGLEFEAVFFIGMDKLASMQPSLFDKYLYVGTTRAATYLGMTCEKTLPPVVEELRKHFVGNWQIPPS